MPTDALPQRGARRAAPTLALERGVPAQRRVLLVGIDGCRPDALLAANTPTIDRLISEGAYSDDARAVAPTLSGPNWSCLLTGVDVPKHGVIDNTFAGADFGTYPHFFTLVKERRRSLFTASFSQWAAIETEIVSGADVSVGGLSDDQVVLQASDLLLNGEPDVVFLHLNDVDSAGHAFGFQAVSPEYVAAIESADARVAALLGALNQRTATGLRSYEDWLVVLTTDHGGFLQAHGGAMLPELRTWILFSGPSIVDESGIFPDTQAVDVTATILDYLGIAQKPEWGLDGVSFLPCIEVLR